MMRKVLVNSVRVTKAGTSIGPADETRAAGFEGGYIGRAGGGMKLEAAFMRFGIEVRDRIAVDFRASFEEFTDCLLQVGAAFVYAAADSDTDELQLAELAVSTEAPIGFQKLIHDSKFII